MSDADDSDDLTDRTLIQDDDYSEAYVARNQRFGVEEPQSESVDEPASPYARLKIPTVGKNPYEWQPC